MKRALMIGAGGWARQCWLDEVLPEFRHKVSVVGLADVDKDVLDEAGELIGLASDCRFTDLEKAFDAIEADFCVISIPPAVHKDAVLLAVQKGMPVLSEKPIADNLADVHAIYRAVTAANIKMAITQNYRFEPSIVTMKNIIDQGELGRLDYIICRYASDYRKPGSWGVDHVHERDNPLLVEGAIHHFDMLRNLAGANCESISGMGWNPEWSSFKHNPNAMFLMKMENGVKAFYEGNSLAAGLTNNWFHELYRAECEKGSVVLCNDQVVRVYCRGENGGQFIEEVPTVKMQFTGHFALLEYFLSWLDGGKALETELKQNIYSAAMVFAAMDTIVDGEVKKVAAYLP